MALRPRGQFMNCERDVPGGRCVTAVNCNANFEKNVMARVGTRITCVALPSIASNDVRRNSTIILMPIAVILIRLIHSFQSAVTHGVASFG